MTSPIAIATSNTLVPVAAPLTAEEMRELVSIGFHGALNGRPHAALRLFQMLEVLRPEEGFPRIGQALALMALGRPDEAARLLEAALASRPHDDSLRVFLGMTLRIANRGHRARSVLSSLAGRTEDSAPIRLARQLSALVL